MIKLQKYRKVTDYAAARGSDLSQKMKQPLLAYYYSLE